MVESVGESQWADLRSTIALYRAVTVDVDESRVDKHTDTPALRLTVMGYFSFLGAGLDVGFGPRDGQGWAGDGQGWAGVGGQGWAGMGRDG